VGAGTVPSDRLIPTQSPSQTAFLGRRIVIIGSTGAGKSTLGRQLSAILSIPHIELDALQWLPNWTPAPRDEFRERVAQLVQSDTWIIDGNYGFVRDLVWGRAESIIWLDYGLSRIWVRLARRTFTRLLTKELLWGTNRERWSNLVEPDNLFVWAVKHRRTRRPEYLTLLARRAAAGGQVVHLCTPAATRSWLEKVKE
jgi:adenylate kinase family enzyme